jgi:hypothetical protein
MFSNFSRKDRTMSFLVENQLADQAVRRNVAAGGHYFDRDTMRGFGSRVHEGYDLGNGDTLVIMSNKDRHSTAVVFGRRHYYLILVDEKGDTHNLASEYDPKTKHMPAEYDYDVCKNTGYWMSLRAARAAAKRLQKHLAVAV